MAIRHGNYKLVKAVGNEKPELYDLTADIGEKGPGESRSREGFADSLRRLERHARAAAVGPANRALRFKDKGDKGRKSKAAK
jgi:hypothetical protein